VNIQIAVKENFYNSISAPERLPYILYIICFLSENFLKKQYKAEHEDSVKKGERNGLKRLPEVFQRD